MHISKFFLTLVVAVFCLYPTEGYSVENNLRGTNTKKINDPAKVARELVHKSDWAPVGTASTDASLQGFPMVNVKSIADSGRDAPSTGNIYLYISDFDFSGKDIKKNNRVTLLFSNETDLSCSQNNVDPMEPTCSRAIISGTLQTLEEGSDDYAIGRHAFHSRHPAADVWGEFADFIFYKLEILNIIVLNGYGGAHFVTPEEYYQVILE